MNGGLTECGRCDRDPCRCEWIKKQKVKDGKVVIDNLWQVMIDLPRWKRKIIKWLWPDIIDVADDLKEYYWQENDNPNP